MAVYSRPDSPFLWILLEGADGRRARRLSTKIPIGATPADRRENLALAQSAYEAAMGDLARVSDSALQRLPEWQNPILNKATKEDIIEKTAQGWQMAVFILGQRVQAGKVFPPLAVKEWASSLLKFSGEIRGDKGMRETCESFMQSLGWLFGN